MLYITVIANEEKSPRREEEEEEERGVQRKSGKWREKRSAIATGLVMTYFLPTDNSLAGGRK